MPDVWFVVQLFFTVTTRWTPVLWGKKRAPLPPRRCNQRPWADSASARCCRWGLTRLDGIGFEFLVLGFAELWKVFEFFGSWFCGTLDGFSLVLLIFKVFFCQMVCFVWFCQMVSLKLFFLDACLFNRVFALLDGQRSLCLANAFCLTACCEGSGLGATRWHFEGRERQRS